MPHYEALPGVFVCAQSQTIESWYSMILLAWQVMQHLRPRRNFYRGKRSCLDIWSS